MNNESTSHVTYFPNSDDPDGDVYELKIKQDKKKEFELLLHEYCEPDYELD